MRAQLVQEVQAKSSSRNKTLWIIYIVLVVFIGTLGFVRLISLFRRIEWRNSLDGAFPAECGSWAASKGCTRVTLEQSGCVRPKSIPAENSVIFDVNVDRLLNTQISECVHNTRGAKIMSPSNLDELDTHGNLIHVTFNSAIFGFIDDLYMMTMEYIPDISKSPQRKIEIQSQLRMGSYDFD